MDVSNSNGYKIMGKRTFMEILEGLGEVQLKELLKNSTLITDRLGQELIKKAADPNSPINVDELPMIENGLRDEALYRLYQLEKLHVFTSSLEFNNGITNRVFSITDFGRKALLIG